MATSQLLSNFGKRGDTSYVTTGVSQGLNTIQVDIEDTAHLSKYFQVIDFTPAFTAGKNCISFNGSSLLQDGSEIKIEVLDSQGNSLYLTAPPSDANYVDIANFTVAIYVYEETVNGPGKVYLVGTTTKGEIVRWSANISINNTYQNCSRVRFYNAPYIEATPVLYPVIEVVTGSILTSTVLTSGSFWFEVRNTNGYYSQENRNFGGTLPANSQILLWSYDGKNPNKHVKSFDPQMKGEILALSYDIAYTLTSNNPPIWQYKHIDTTATILAVLNKSTVRISSIPLGPIAKLNPDGGIFSCSYAAVKYLPQATVSTVLGNSGRQ